MTSDTSQSTSAFETLTPADCGAFTARAVAAATELAESHGIKVAESAVLETYRQLRLLHAAGWVFALSPEVDDWAVHARGRLDMLRGLA
jgi:hypothetical protein